MDTSSTKAPARPRLTAADLAAQFISRLPEGRSDGWLTAKQTAFLASLADQAWNGMSEREMRRLGPVVISDHHGHDCIHGEAAGGTMFEVHVNRRNGAGLLKVL